jgi:large conductance mechanosensitive channel
MSEDNFEKLLEHVKAIRESVEPKPAPLDAPVPSGFVSEFQAFLSKYGVIGLAIAVIIGGAAGKLVSSLVSDILMPVVTFFIPGGAWREATLTLGPIVMMVGSFIGNVIDFLVIALVVFIVMKQLEKSPIN